MYRLFYMATDKIWTPPEVDEILDVYNFNSEEHMTEPYFVSIEQLSEFKPTQEIYIADERGYAVGYMNPTGIFDFYEFVLDDDLLGYGVKIKDEARHSGFLNDLVTYGLCQVKTQVQKQLFCLTL